MVRFKGALLIGILLFSTIMLIADPLQYCAGADAYYTDIKGTSGCSIYAPAQSVAPQQNSTIIAMNSGSLNGNGNGNNARKYTGFMIQNTDPQNSTVITGIQVATTNPSGITMSSIKLGGYPFGSGNVNADGTGIAIGSCIIAHGATATLNIDFSENMLTHRPFTIIFTFSDGSVKRIDNINPV
jgi:hypothetical protein